MAGQRPIAILVYTTFWFFAGVLWCLASTTSNPHLAAFKAIFDGWRYRNEVQDWYSLFSAFGWTAASQAAAPGTVVGLFAVGMAARMRGDNEQWSRNETPYLQ